jgi:hypothetical protein
MTKYEWRVNDEFPNDEWRKACGRLNQGAPVMSRLAAIMFLATEF